MEWKKKENEQRTKLKPRSPNKSFDFGVCCYARTRNRRSRFNGERERVVMCQRRIQSQSQFYQVHTNIHIHQTPTNQFIVFMYQLVHRPHRRIQFQMNSTESFFKKKNVHLIYKSIMYGIRSLFHVYRFIQGFFFSLLNIFLLFVGSFFIILNGLGHNKPKDNLNVECLCIWQ